MRQLNSHQFWQDFWQTRLDRILKVNNYSAQWPFIHMKTLSLIFKMPFTFCVIRLISLGIWKVIPIFFLHISNIIKNKDWKKPCGEVENLWIRGNPMDLLHKYIYIPNYLRLAFYILFDSWLLMTLSIILIELCPSDESGVQHNDQFWSEGLPLFPVLICFGPNLAGGRSRFCWCSSLISSALAII